MSAGTGDGDGRTCGDCHHEVIPGMSKQCKDCVPAYQNWTPKPQPQESCETCGEMRCRPKNMRCDDWTPKPQPQVAPVDPTCTFYPKGQCDRPDTEENACDKCRQPTAQDILDVLDEAVVIISRYRNETPLGNQPHMIAHVADAWLNREAVMERIKEKGKV